jgi:hypothetical protein
MSKYVTLADFLQFMPTQIQTQSDQFALQAALDWAEGTFENLTGSKFDSQTMTNEEPMSAWISRKGEITLIAKSRGPVTAVSAVSYRVLPGTNWQTLSWDAANDIVLPVVSAPPEPDSWAVKIYTSSLGYYNVAAADFWWRWTYTGGYSTIPEEIKFPILRLTQWKYKLREAPLGRINSEMFGTREIIQDLPNDVAFDILRWTRLAMG